MVPLDLLKPRVVWTNALYGWIANLANFQVLFYFPIYFESIQDQSATASGVNSLPFMAFLAVGSMLSRFLIIRTRLLQPYELCNSISGAYLVTAAQSLFANRMLSTLASKYHIIDPIQVLTTSASEITRVFQGAELIAVHQAYMVGIRDVFAFPLAGAVATVLISLGILFKNLPAPTVEASGDEELVDGRDAVLATTWVVMFCGLCLGRGYHGRVGSSSIR
ncbi:hypothetical protein BJX65DRAFT_312399 [Aspergillus insuetus]